MQPISPIQSPPRFDLASLPTARRLDLIAGFELSIGHTRMAEMLANAAATIREKAL